MPDRLVARLTSFPSHPMLLLHRQAARLGALLLLLLALPAGAVHGQLRASLDSASIAPGVKVDARHTGASRAVVDSADARSAAAMTFSELMQARAASVSVMMSGGTLRDGGRFLVRGPSTIFTAGAPLLVVDGMRMDEQEDDSLGVTSRLDDIAVDDIATVEVLRGPAAAAMYGAGASSGVIVVTTRRGARGFRMRGKVFGDARRDVGAYPDSYRRSGTTTSPNMSPDVCRLYESASGACVPNVLERWNPVRDGNALRAGSGVRASGELSGASASSGIRLSATGRRSTGIGRDDELSQLHSRVNVSHHLGFGFDLDAHAAYVRATSAGSQAGEAILRGASWRTSTIDPTRSAILIDSAYLDSPDRQLRHATWGAEVAYRGVRGLTLRAALTGDSVTTGGARGFPSGPGYTRELRQGSAGRRAVSRATAEVAHGWRGASGVLVIGTERDEQRRRQADTVLFRSGDVKSALSDGTVLQSRTWEGANVAVFGTARLALGDRLALGAAVRRERDYALGVASHVAPAADLTWRVPGTMAGAAVRARMAYGESVQPFANFALIPLLSVAQPYSGAGVVAEPEGPRTERMHEFEGGLDLDWGDRASLALTGYNRGVRDLAAPGVGSPNSGYASTVAFLRMVSRGLELDGRGRVVSARALRWELRAIAALQTNRLVGGTNYREPNRGVLVDGEPVWSVERAVVAFADANGDGILGPGEYRVDRTAARERSSSAPRFEGSLHSLVTIGSRLGLSAILDRRSGFSSVPATSAEQCARNLCRGLFDPSVTIAEQANALALQGGNGASDASFTRLREVALRWALPVGAEGATGATLVIAGRDLYTWTGWSGLDPEINTNPRALLVQGDLRGVPLPRRVTIGLELGVAR